MLLLSELFLCTRRSAQAQGGPGETMVFENAQDRKDTWLMDEDEQKLTYSVYEKAQNCGTVDIKKVTHTAPNPAKFNSYNSFVLHSDLVSEGIQINNTYDNIISQIQITANVGEIENYRANDKDVFSIVNNLIGPQNQRYRARFWLTSELGIPLNTNGEDYDFVIL